MDYAHSIAGFRAVVVTLESDPAGDLLLGDTLTRKGEEKKEQYSVRQLGSDSGRIWTNNLMDS
jgi:hypothetical protein